MVVGVPRSGHGFKVSKLLDVRESWTTTQITAELRLSGGSSGGNPLRRLERFELDNGYFQPNQRTFSRPRP